ncbi:translin associated factor X isoform X2 [Leptinotarsa decemlineata]|uniref:translin associated factor X isoform X2 n=1 Tax=Leptinotarsa decemlineata TaxID=7539 RepID=UPI003D30724E
MGRKRGRPAVGDKAKETLLQMEEDNQVLLMFRDYASTLDEKHDRHERIVKQSRDITIEAKRIIFLLHNTNTDIESKRAGIIEEAERRLKVLIDTNFKTIASELKNEDSHQFHKAYTSGLQEFIEAYAFCQYVKDKTIGDYHSVNQSFQYEEDDEKFSLLFPQIDFILGLADFTGELMRKCINTLGIGNVSDCFTLCNFVKLINTGCLGLVAPGNKELSRKAFVLRQSLSKMELVCYNIQIRGTEIPKHMLMSVIESTNVDANEDEGFY